MGTIRIDGQDLDYEPGETVIQVAHRNGIEVPHYCYHPGLSLAGNCRICMVEVEGSDRPQISCKMECRDGVAVRTDSELAKAARAATMEMLLVNHPLDCPICDQAGECHLQEYSYQLGHGESRSTTPKTHLPKNVPFGSEIVYDGERCIKCTLCVRFCEEITETSELAMGNRSDNEMVMMTSAGEFESNYSMNIVDICPVGALTSRDFRFQSRLWFMDFTPSICTGCAKGCNVTIGGRGGRFLRMEPRENQAINQWWMCDTGRLGYKFVNDATRFPAPLVREGDALRAVTWEEALVAAGEALAARESNDVLIDGGASVEGMESARALAGVLGGTLRFAAATGEADAFLMVAEKGANARGAEVLGVPRQTEAAPAGVLILERDEHIPEDWRKTSGAVVALTPSTAMLPDSVRVAFPYGTWAERGGLLLNADGIVQEIRPAAQVGPGNLMSEIEVLEQLCFELDAEYAPRDRGDILSALATGALAEAGVPEHLLPRVRTAGAGGDR